MAALASIHSLAQETYPAPAHNSPPQYATAPSTFEMKQEYVDKQKEYEAKKARAKALQLRLTCTICGAKPKTLLNCPCGTTQCVRAALRVRRRRHS